MQFYINQQKKSKVTKNMSLTSQAYPEALALSRSGLRTPPYGPNKHPLGRSSAAKTPSPGQPGMVGCPSVSSSGRVLAAGESRIGSCPTLAPDAWRGKDELKMITLYVV